MQIIRKIKLESKELTDMQNALLTISNIMDNIQDELTDEQSHQLDTAFDIMASLICMNEEGEKWFNDQGW